MKLQKILSTLIVLAAFGAHAQQDTGSTKGYLTSEGTSERWAGWAPFFGLNAGYMDQHDDLTVEGVPASAKLIGSYVVPHMNYVFDLGVGYNNQTFTEDAAPDKNVGTTVGEVAARYQWANRWQAGVVWNTLFNKGAAYGANQADAQFAGLQLMKEFGISDNWMMRLGGRYMTDVNVDDAYLNTVMVDVEFGYNPWSSGKRGVEAAAAAAAAASAATAANANHAAEAGSSELESGMTNAHGTMGGEDLSARQDFLLFDSGSTTLNADDTAKLDELAAVITATPDAVETIEVVGYTDPSGSTEVNQKISQQRADAVKQELVNKGVPEEKITVVARGEDSSMGSYAKNRRAELNFKGVKDTSALNKVVNPNK